MSTKRPRILSITKKISLIFFVMTIVSLFSFGLPMNIFADEEQVSDQSAIEECDTTQADSADEESGNQEDTVEQTSQEGQQDFQDAEDDTTANTGEETGIEQDLQNTQKEETEDTQEQQDQQETEIETEGSDAEESETLSGGSPEEKDESFDGQEGENLADEEVISEDVQGTGPDSENLSDEEDTTNEEKIEEVAVSIIFTTDTDGYIEVGQPVCFTAEISGTEADGYIWDFGDGGSSSSVCPEHIYLADGNYTVTLEVEGKNGEVYQSSSIVHSSDHDPGTTEWYVSGDASRNADDPEFYDSNIPVGNDPENPITLESVFEHIVDGDTVYFLPGRYEDTYTGNENASIDLDGIGTGTEENPIKFIAYDDVVFDGKGKLESAFTFSDPLSNLGFYNFTFVNYTGAAIKIDNEDSEGIEIVDNTFIDNSKAIEAEMKEGLKVENNVFTGNGTAMEIDSEDVIIKNNVIEESQTGIKVDGPSDDIIVESNDFFNNEIDLVGVELGENNIFLDPLLEVGQDYSVSFDEQSPAITNKIIKIIKTDKEDYLYTEDVIIRGNGYQPGQSIILNIKRADGSNVEDIYIKTDENGNFDYGGYSVDYAGKDFLIEVTDLEGNIIEILSFTDDSGLNYVDLNNWSPPPGDAGSWEVQPGGRTVFQTVNGGKVYFLSPDNYMDRTITGTLMVRYNGEDEDNYVYYDDDWIGFVFGYVDSSNYMLLEWRGGYGYNYDSGFELIKVTNGFQDILATNYTPSSSDTYADQGRYMCGYEKKNENDLGWKFSNDTPTDNMPDLHDNRYIFDLIYTESEIKIFIDDDEIFDVTGTFVEGKFGFYNYSQSMVEYGNVQSAPGSLVPVPPTAGDDSYGMDTGATLEKDRYEGILSNDYDSNLDPFSISMVTDVNHGSLSLNLSTGAFTYTPESGFEGVDTFTYKLIEDDDPTMVSDTATVSISVQEANVAPTAISISNDEVEVSAETGDIVGSLSTTDGNENDSFDYMLIDNASGKFGISGNRILVADSSAYSICDVYSITVRSTDLRGLYIEEVFNITVTPANSSVSPASATFDLNTSNTGQGNYDDIDLTIDFDGNTLESISCSGSLLAESTDYTISGADVTIKKEYLEKKNTGNISLVFDFSSGDDYTVTVTIRDSASQPPVSGTGQQDDNDAGEDGDSSRRGASGTPNEPLDSFVKFNFSGNMILSNKKINQISSPDGKLKLNIKTKDLGGKNSIDVNAIVISGEAKVDSSFIYGFEVLKKIRVNELGERYGIDDFTLGSDLYRLDVVGNIGTKEKPFNDEVEITLEFDEGLINPTLCYWDESSYEWVTMYSSMISKNKLTAKFDQLQDLILCVRDDIRTQVDMAVDKNVGGSLGNYLGSKLIDLNIDRDSFPEDVVLKVTEVTVTGYIDMAGNRDGKINIDGKIYDLKVIGIETGKYYGTKEDPFGKPLEIILECSAGNKDPVIAWFDEDEGEWIEMETLRIDSTHVMAKLEHFSKWAVIEKKVTTEEEWLKRIPLWLMR